MDTFVWKSSFELGFEQIDQQHQKLLGYLNGCIESPAHSDGVIENLKNYMNHHFSVEEKLMQLVSYPGAENHQREHQLFEDQISAIESAGTQGDANAKMLLVSFLRDWFLNHVISEDKRYAQFINTRLSQAEIVDLLDHGGD